MAERKIINVRVTNENKADFSDDYSGIHYVFGASKTVSLPLEAARHIFGYKVQGADAQSMFEHVCKRWGWNSPQNVVDGFAKVKALWTKFSFTPVAVKMVEQAIIDPTALAEAEDDEKQESSKFQLGKQAIAASA